jgi:4-oxalocrotonate tautomerase
MPHVILKMVEGRTEEQKKALAEDLVSVAIEDVREEEWMAEVFVPDIQQRPGTIYRMPGYGPED